MLFKVSSKWAKERQDLQDTLYQKQCEYIESKVPVNRLLMNWVGYEMKIQNNHLNYNMT